MTSFVRYWLFLLAAMAAMLTVAGAVSGLIDLIERATGSTTAAVVLTLLAFSVAWAGVMSSSWSSNAARWLANNLLTRRDAITPTSSTRSNR